MYEKATTIIYLFHSTKLLPSQLKSDSFIFQSNIHLDGSTSAIDLDRKMLPHDIRHHCHKAGFQSYEESWRSLHEERSRPVFKAQ